MLVYSHRPEVRESIIEAVGRRPAPDVGRVRWVEAAGIAEVLAACDAGEADLLVLDEPTVGLDVPTRRAIVEHVHALVRDDGIAVLWATHLIDEISDDDDDVMILPEGRVLADGSLADVLKKAKAEDIAGNCGALTVNGGR